MTITSMSNRELYKTLTGCDYPHGSSSKTDTDKSNSVDLSKAIALSKETRKIELQAEDLDKMQKLDRFEQSKVFKVGETSNNAAWVNDIDFNDRYTNLVIQSRSLMATCNGGSVPTKESIAEYYGKMAKRLDEAYTEGKFTKEEYDYLNEGIAERMEHAAECAEDTAARFEVGYRNSMSLKTYERHMSMTREERKADIEAQVSQYINRYFKIDRTSLTELFNSIRYGK
ncbi:MAG: hypothetical protein NC395_08260 [Prevotella sp.]|nr:hypothetical protein [Prevotella sp.]